MPALVQNDAKAFIIDAYSLLMDLAVSNAAIGIKAQKRNGIKLGCMYGVGIGYYEAARAFRGMAIRSGLVNAEEVVESSYPTFQHQAGEQGLALSPGGPANACPLDRFGLESRNTPPES